MASEEGVSSVVGTALMLGLTVTVFGAVSFGVLAYFEHNEPAPRAEAAFVADGTRYLLRHSGGEPMPLAGGSLLVNLNGLERRLAMTEFAPQVDDGATWHMGETLCVSGPVPPCLFEDASVGGAVLIHRNAIVATHGERGAANPCAEDTAPPSYAWSQVPSDVSRLSIGGVTLVLLASDACPGVDESLPPRIWYRMQDGSDPAFQPLTVTSTGAGTWAATVPDQGWSSRAGQTLEYYADRLRDRNLNSVTTAVETELVEDVPPTYIASASASPGAVADLAKAQAANDGDAAATFTEGATGSTSTHQPNAQAVVASTGWTAPANAYASDDLRATNSNTNPTFAQYALADPVAPTGAITSVVLAAEVSITTRIDDGWQLQACLGATCSAASPVQAGSPLDATVTYDVTALRPGGGTWSWTDVNNLEVRVVPVKTGTRDGTWRIDHVRADVGQGATYSLAGEGAFSGVPAGTTQTLELRYMASGDTFSVQVWDGVGWNTRGAALDAAGLTEWSYTLTLAEQQAGSPRIRLADATPGGTTSGVLSLDYARVVTA